MPPDPRDWLPEGHLAWFMLETVEQLDLAPFEPRMMIALLLYAYARGERSSRGIERKCIEDVAYRVIAAHRTPDHATSARFRVRHEESLAALFTEVLSLCEEAGRGEGRGDRDRRHQGARERVASLQPRLRAARAGDPQGGRRR